MLAVSAFSKKVEVARSEFKSPLETHSRLLFGAADVIQQHLAPDAQIRNSDLADDAPDGDEGVAAEEEPRQRRLHLSHAGHARKQEGRRPLSQDQYHKIILDLMIFKITCFKLSPHLIQHSESKTEDRISL